MKRLYILWILSMGVWAAAAQTDVHTLGNDDPFTSYNTHASGKVTITQDQTLANLADRFLQHQATRKGFAGWRVHLFFGNGYGAQQNAENVKKQFENSFPDIPVYIVYEAPYFRVRAGDFRFNEKNKAYALKKKIEAQFPSSWIVPDQINFPGL